MPTAYVRAALQAGDYSLQGHELPAAGRPRSAGIAIERKRPNELFDCFTKDRNRFRREFERLAAYRYAAVVIEGTVECIGTHYATWEARGEVQYGNVSPAAVINSLISWSIRYGVHVVYAGRRLDVERSRELAQAYVYRTLEKFAGMIAREREEMREESAQAGESAADAAQAGREEGGGALAIASSGTPGLVTMPAGLAAVHHIRAWHGRPFECLRCGEIYDPGERVPIGAWSAISAWFTAAHGLCLPLGTRAAQN